jgi:hypothetical protein
VKGGHALAVIDLAVPHPAGITWYVEDGYPVIEVIRDGVHLRFKNKCPWCRSYHWHGAHDTSRCTGEGCPCPRHPDYHHSRGPCLCPIGTGDGHRGAHCWTDSPLRATGYILVEVAQ